MEAATHTQDGAPGALGGLLARARRVLPEGNTLPHAVWLRRHRALLILLWLQTAGLAIYAIAAGYGVVHSLQEAGIVAAFAVAAMLTKDRPRVASTFVSVGMISVSAVLVHLTGGLIEAHFHFFVMILLLTLYEDWIPFLIAAAYVLFHHGVAGTVDPGSVYNHADALAHPWKWAGIHALFVTAAGIAGVTAWKLNEDYRAETQTAYDKAHESERSLAEAQQLARIGSFAWDLESGAVTWSEALYSVVGVDPASYEPSYEGYLAGIHADDRGRVKASLAEAVTHPGAFSHQYRYQHPDGKLRTFYARGEVVAGADGRPATVVGTCQDVTERELAQAQALQRAEAQAAVADLGERALEGVEISTLLRDAVISVSGLLGTEVAAVLEATGDDFIVRAAVEAQSEMIGTRVPAGDRSQAGYTLLCGNPVIVRDWNSETRFERPEVLRQEGSRSGVTVIIGGGHEPFGVLGTQSSSQRDFDEDDINFLQSVANVLATAIQRRKIEEEIRHQAVHDPLTNLPNRSLFSDRLAQALAHARRQTTSVAVLFLDLDQFKLVNDSHGHEAGDELLRAVAPRISDTLRAVDTVARFGGDEFGILIEDVETERDATRAAERIAAALSRPFVLRGREHFVTATVGIAIGEGQEAPETLIRDADAAMYRAKDRGRGRYEIFDEVMRAKVVDHLRTENELRLALDRDELRLHYQPIVSLTTGAIAGVEGLLRWQHPERGLQAPGEFISMAEESGLIVPVGRWVLEEACHQVSAWHQERPDAAPIGISVNLSARQINDPGLPELVGAVLAESGADPLSLSLEVTETALLDDSESSHETLRQLKTLGVRLVLDDFGTGFSSLDYLRRFPFDSLKVDRSFIARLGDQPEDAAIVKAIAGIAAALGLDVTAEGIETEEQLKAVRALGCQHAQGFYLVPPLPAENLARVLAADQVAQGGPSGRAKRAPIS